MSESRAPLRLVCLAPYVPHPRINHAGGRFLLEYLPRMAKLVSVTLLAPATPDNEVAAAYAPEGLDLHLVPVGVEWRRRLRALSLYPVDTVLGFSPGMLVRRALDRDALAAELIRAADVVEVQFSQYLPLLDSVRRIAPHTPLTAHEHDVFSDYLRDALAGARTVKGRLRARGRLWRIPHEERRLLDMCSLVITHNHKDVDVLRQLGVRSPVEAVYPPVTVPARPAAVEGARVTFVGAMWRVENQRAVRWFLDNAWPAVHAAVPQARFVVAGDGPVAWLKDLASSPGVEVTGFLPSLDPVYEDAAVAVVPVLGSQGIKVKALQAMAFGLPVVSTRAGAAGIVEESGEEVFAGISDDTRRFADAVIRCLNDPDEARLVGARARRWVLDNCDFDAVVSRIALLYRELPAPERGRA